MEAMDVAGELQEHLRHFELETTLSSGGEEVQGEDEPLTAGLNRDCRACKKTGEQLSTGFAVPNLWLIGTSFCCLSLALLFYSFLRLGILPGLRPDAQQMALDTKLESEYFNSTASFLSRVHQIEENGERTRTNGSDTHPEVEQSNRSAEEMPAKKDATISGRSHKEAAAEDSNRSAEEESSEKDSTMNRRSHKKAAVQEPTFACKSALHFANATAMDGKGLAVDDTTFSQCPSMAITMWPNTDKSLMSVRLFKAWDANWDAKYDRKAIWKDLREYVWENGIKVLFGTQISCNETADDADWTYVKELMGYIGWYYAMGLAIGNEVELIHKHGDSSPECIARIFQQKYFQRKVDARAQEMDTMEGFQAVPLTTVMGGFVLAQPPFINTPEAGVADFFRYVSGKYGRRWVYTWNVYPYFEPNVQINPNDPAACDQVIGAACSFAPEGMTPTMLRSLRQGTQMITGRPDDVTWLGETGWSWPRAATLSTVMSQCKNFSSRENFKRYYENFLKWDLSLGHGVAPMNHVFYFTMRDANNWDLSEYFGLVPNCTSDRCKIHA